MLTLIINTNVNIHSTIPHIPTCTLEISSKDPSFLEQVHLHTLAHVIANPFHLWCSHKIIDFHLKTKKHMGRSPSSYPKLTTKQPFDHKHTNIDHSKWTLTSLINYPKWISD